MELHMQRNPAKALLQSLSLIMFSLPGVDAFAYNIPKTVVTCVADQCPAIADIISPKEKLTSQAIIYQTSNQPEFMTRTVAQFSPKDNGGWQYIVVDQTKYANTQPVIGFGGAFTDGASILYHYLPATLQKELIDAYFSPKGIAYSLGRVPMASNDFSCRSEPGGMPSLTSCSNVASLYSYADRQDSTLNHFALQSEDVDFKIPMIQAAMNATSTAELKLFASPWSAPAWMKSNGSMIHGSLKPEFRQLWADYFIKFLESYNQYQINIWGLTVQNEPEESPLYDPKGMQTWQTMYSSKQEEADFVKNYLGPAIRQFEIKYATKINLMIHDDQLTKIHDRVSTLNDPELAQYVDGAALHWYMNLDHLYPNLDKAYDTLNKTSGKGRFILATEACEGYFPIGSGPEFGSWARGEAYGHDIISDFNHHVSGWTDWNLLLDMKGGPTWAKNYLDAPILVDLAKQVFYKQPMYYYLGHFSKFVRPSSQLLASQSNGPFPLEEVSFKVPAHDNLPETIVIVVLNRDVTGRKYYIKDTDRYLNMNIPAHAIQTIIYKAGA
jgi:glucosylceramidase